MTENQEKNQPFVHQFNDYLEPPTEEVLLPSKGIFYNEEGVSMIRANGGKILIRPMTFKEEQLMVSSRIVKTGQLISDILRSCIKTPNVDVDKLLSFDRTFLFYYLRSISYGPEYSISAKCPHCGSYHEYIINIGDLPVIYADPQKDKEPIEVVLPKTKRKISLRYSRGIDENFYIQKSLEGKEVTLIDTLVRLTTDIEGVPRQHWYVFYENLNLIDAYHLKQSFNGRDFGLKTETNLTCKNESCKNQFVTDVPMTADFFRPQLS